MVSGIFLFMMFQMLTTELRSLIVYYLTSTYIELSFELCYRNVSRVLQCYIRFIAYVRKEKIFAFRSLKNETYSLQVLLLTLADTD